MNILFVYSSDNTKGGADGILCQIAEQYLKKNAHVYVLFLHEKKYGDWENMKDNNNLILYYGGSLTRCFRNLYSLHKISFDYSFTSIVKLTGFVGFLKHIKVLHIKTMVGRESTSIFARFSGFKLFYYLLCYHVGYRGVDILICQTNPMKQQLIKHLPWLEKNTKIIVIPNPVNIMQMNEKANANIDVSAYTPYVVAAGRFIPEKAYDILLDAFAEFTCYKQNFRLVILGDGNLKKQIESQIERLHLKDKVKLVGQVDNVYPWFKHASLCVVSSRLEGFPNVLLQMMSQSERVVSTLCAGDIEKIDGLITCPIEDKKALSKAMLHCIESEVGNRRDFFDKELQRRSIDNFIKEVEKNTNN